MSTKSTMTELILEKRTAVSDLLAELNLESSYFAVLIDGRTVSLDHMINEGEKVIILPKIAGG
ncbi:MAG: MoaD/ThiS family protein [Candidatus Helarchaeota archaeon]|nr:MoaD/ThiS family protein [Candidatus Helarchaeota archaeon]